MTGNAMEITPGVAVPVTRLGTSPMGEVDGYASRMYIFRTVTVCPAIV
jgi:hypothetical protein